MSALATAGHVVDRSSVRAFLREQLPSDWRGLGCAVAAWNLEGNPVVGELGELVVTEPMPSMPTELSSRSRL